jgi:segregation and condensation protein A
MAYHIQLPQFEGPLELLLSLIEKQKLDITRVSLARVTDQYLEYISSKQDISLENLAWFLVIASRLILIKSKALLPILSFSDEEEEEMQDLEYQLREYKKFKEAASQLRGLFDLNRRMFSWDGVLGMQTVFYPPGNLSAQDMEKHFRNVLQEIPVFEVIEEKMLEEVVTLEEKIVSLRMILRKKVEVSFSDVASSAKNKVEVIVSFLAMLELIKQRVAYVEQSGLFTDIRLKNRDETFSKK